MDWASFLAGYVFANVLALLGIFWGFWLGLARFLDSPIPGQKK